MFRAVARTSAGLRTLGALALAGYFPNRRRFPAMESSGL